MKKLTLLLTPALTLIVLAHFALGEIVKKGAVGETGYLEYRGVLTDPSGVPLNGEHLLIFRLYESPTGTIPLWEETHHIALDGEEFRVLLGRQTPLPSLSSGSSCIGVLVDGEELSPRHPLAIDAGERSLRTVPPGSELATPPPHLTGVFDDRFVNEMGDTMSGDLVVDADVGIGTMSPDAPLDVEGSSVGTMLSVSNNDGGIGTVSESFGDSPLWSIGLYGEGRNTSTGLAVGSYGTATNTATGQAYGGYFTTTSSGTASHTGVKSEANAATTASAYGVDAWVSNSGSGDAVAGLFQTDIEGGGLHEGIRAQAACEDAGSSAYAVDGFAASYGPGNAYGGYFSTYSDGTGTHYGVYAYGAGINEDAYGIYGKGENSGSTVAYGGYFQTSQYGTGPQYGVYAGPDCSTYSTNPLYGGYFTTSSSGSGSHYGLYSTGYGSSSGNVRGIYAYASNTGSGEAAAGRFQVTSSGTGTHYGVYGIEAAGGTGAAVYASGDFIASGDKNAIVKTSQGHRLLSVIESPEVWFEDFGESHLVHGMAHVDLDPLFLETVTIDGAHPMKVFIQVNDEDCNGTAVKRGTTDFDVVELGGGTSDASFSYRVVAKRKGYEEARLRETDAGRDDPNLYPELWREIENPQDAKPAEDGAEQDRQPAHEAWLRQARTETEVTR